MFRNNSVFLQLSTCYIEGSTICLLTKEYKNRYTVRDFQTKETKNDKT